VDGQVRMTPFRKGRAQAFAFPHRAGGLPRRAWEAPLDEGCNCAWVVPVVMTSSCAPSDFALVQRLTKEHESNKNAHDSAPCSQGARPSPRRALKPAPVLSLLSLRRHHLQPQASKPRGRNLLSPSPDT
jgi:hypothetical protein